MALDARAVLSLLTVGVQYGGLALEAFDRWRANKAPSGASDAEIFAKFDTIMVADTHDTFRKGRKRGEAARAKPAP